MNVRQNTMLIPIISHGLGYIKLPILSIVAGWSAGSTVMMMFQVAPEQLEWWQNPVVISAAVTAIFLSVNKLIDVFNEYRKQKFQAQEDDDKERASFSDKLAELTNKEREQLLGGLKELHEREILSLKEQFGREVHFIKGQRNLKDLEAFEARARAHWYGNELTRTYGHIMQLQRLCNEAGVTFPQFDQKGELDFLSSVKHEIDAYRKRLLEEIDEVHRIKDQ
jgi:hypothetical protein